MVVVAVVIVGGLRGHYYKNEEDKLKEQYWFEYEEHICLFHNNSMEWNLIQSIFIPIKSHLIIKNGYNTKQESEKMSLIFILILLISCQYHYINVAVYYWKYDIGWFVLFNIYSFYVRS